MYDGKFLLMDDIVDENCFVIKCLFDSFDFNDLLDNIIDIYVVS